MGEFSTRKLETAIQVIECNLLNQDPCDALDPKAVTEAYTSILNTLNSLATEGSVKWYHYFDDNKLKLEPVEVC